MATRSLIAKQIDADNCRVIYCHWGGYPSGVGKTLMESYSDPAKLDTLLDLGDISALRAEIGEKHEKRSDQPYVTAYHRDCGEEFKDVQARTIPVSELKAHGKDYGAEFLYLLGLDGSWSVDGKPLDATIKRYEQGELA